MNLENDTNQLQEPKTVKRKRMWLRFLLLLFLIPIFGMCLVILRASLSFRSNDRYNDGMNSSQFRFDAMPVGMNFMFEKHKEGLGDSKEFGVAVATPVSFDAGVQTRSIAYLTTRIAPIHFPRMGFQHELKHIRALSNTDETDFDLLYVGTDDWTGLDLVTCPLEIEVNSISPVPQPCLVGDELDTAILNPGERHIKSMNFARWKPVKVSVIGVNGIADFRATDAVPIPYLMLNMKLHHGTPLYKYKELVGIVVGGGQSGSSDDNLGSLALPAALVEGAIGAILRDPRWTSERRRQDIERYRASIANSTRPAASQFDQRSSNPEVTEPNLTDGVNARDGLTGDLMSPADATITSSSEGRASNDTQAVLNFSPAEKGPLRGHSLRNRTPSVPVQTAMYAQDAVFEKEARDLAAQIRSAKPEEQPVLRQKLDVLNDRHFEYRQQQRQLEIERLSSRIDSLRLLRVRRQENKAKILELRTNDLLGTASDSDWNGTGAGDETVNAQLRSSTTLTKSGTNSPIAVSSTTADDANEPTFKGITVSQWMRKLETERDRYNLVQAIRAMLHLVTDVNPGDLARAVFRMSRGLNLTQNRGEEERIIVSGSDTLLCLLKSDIAVYVLAAELDGKKGIPRNGFKVLVADWLDLLVNYPAPSKERRLLSDAWDSPQIPKQSIASARREIRRRSRQLIGKLVEWSRRDESLNDWIVECSQSILQISEQPVSTYPELIPIAEKVFADIQSPMRLTAAELLSDIETHSEEIILFAEPILRSYPDVVEDLGPIYKALNCFVRLSTNAPLAVVKRLREELGHQWDQIETSPGPAPGPNATDPVPAHVASFVRLLYALASIGGPARDVIPYLQSISQSTTAQRETNWPLRKNFPTGFPDFANPELDRSKHKLQDYINDTIKQIEEAKSKPKSEPLPADEPFKVEESNANQKDSIPINNIPIGPADNVASTPKPTTDEPTFDGVPYSQWLKMLETERKPEKLAAAIEACGRLAEPKDERRIARLIFLAARFFEPMRYQVRNEVSEAGWSALQRLNANEVVDELMAAIDDDGSYKNGRTFQAYFVEHRVSPSLIRTLKTRADDIVAKLVTKILKSERREAELAAIASSVWHYSNRSLDEFGGLKEVLLKIIEDGPPITGADRNSVLADAWSILATNVVDGAADLPGLALMLMKQVDTDDTNKIYTLIGKMGRHAEPAVPLLVDRFVESWKVYEASDFKLDHQRDGRRIARGRRQGSDNADPDSNSSQSQQSVNASLFVCTEIVQTLGRIGVGERGFSLLRQLRLSSPPDHIFNGVNPDSLFFEALKKAIRGFVQYPQPEKSVQLIGDKTMIHGGRWIIRAVLPEEPETQGSAVLYQYHMNLRTRQNDGPLLGRDQFGSVRILPLFKINETTNPKEISFAENTNDTKEWRQRGIYELTETTLKIQLANIDQPRPTEFAKDQFTIPQGQLLLLMERDLDVTVQRPKNDE